MKKLILAIAIVLTLLFTNSTIVEARVRVRGYTRSNGSYVLPHYRTSPNRYKFDNWSTKGNYNPYTGKRGALKWY